MCSLFLSNFPEEVNKVILYYDLFTIIFMSRLWVTCLHCSSLICSLIIIIILCMSSFIHIFGHPSVFALFLFHMGSTLSLRLRVLRKSFSSSDVSFCICFIHKCNLAEQGCDLNWYLPWDRIVLELNCKIFD